MKGIGNLKTHIINYSKIRDIYTVYRKSGYSKKYYEEHTADLILHKAVKTAFDQLDAKKIPTIKALQKENTELISQKRRAYTKYYSIKKEMKNILIAKANVDRILGEDSVEKRKKNHRKRDKIL